LAKLARAKLHRDSLQENLALTVPKEPVPLIARKDETQPGQYIVHAGALPDFTEWGAIIGDAIHDLRSPLDHLAWAVVVRHLGGEPDCPRKVSFPIVDCAEWFENTYTVQQLDSALRARFEFYQPYKGAKAPPTATTESEIIHPLALLRDLSNDDKHKVITPFVAWNQAIQINADPLGNGVAILGFAPPAPLQENAEVMLMRAPNASEFATEVQVGVAVPTISLRDGIDPIQALDGMAEVVLQAISEFEPFT
jgi:hypothetical protein